jgi:hypothetical protein
MCKCYIVPDFFTITNGKFRHILWSPCITYRSVVALPDLAPRCHALLQWLTHFFLSLTDRGCPVCKTFLSLCRLSCDVAMSFDLATVFVFVPVGTAPRVVCRASELW